MAKKKKRKSFQSDEPCVACGTESVDRCFHHVKHRGSGGLDESYNMMPLCQEHHTEIHMLNNTRFAQKYDTVTDWLMNNDWEYLDEYSKWAHLE